jgi:outer membrane protein, multidrug efflux system
MKYPRGAILAGLAGCVSACTAGPDYRPKTAADMGVPANYVGTAHSENPGDISSWWRGFDDPVLTELVERTLVANPDVAQSLARVRQARATLQQTRGGTLPQVDASSRNGRNFNSDAPDQWSFSRSIDARWTVDLFGGQRRSVEASRASYEAAAFNLANAQALLVAEVARNYVDMRTARRRLGVAQASLAVQDQNAQIADWRAQAGLVSSIDVAQARAQRAQTAANVPLLEQSEAQARYRLSVLTGAAPGAIDELIAGEVPLPEPPAALQTGAPANILRQRPDVRAVERDLAAATARIGVAEAELYPALSLSGSIATSANSLGGLADVLTGGLFANLASVIFDGGQRKAAVRSQTAAADGAFAAYRSAVLGALEDVENALVARVSAEKRISALQQQVEASSNAAFLARSNYRAGLTDFRTLLESERSLLSAQDGLADANADYLTAIIQLYLALGGGWKSDDNLQYARAK